MFHILLIEDDQADQLIFERHIKKCGIDYKLTICDSIADSKRALDLQKFDFVFCDFNLPDGSALDLLQAINTKDEIPVIVFTSQGDIVKATESLKKGAFDFITKDNVNSASLERIIMNVSRSIREKKKRHKLESWILENNANTRAILDNTSDAIWSLDINNRILIINSVAIDNFKKHCNYSPSIGDDFFTKIPHSYLEVFKPLSEVAFNGENSTSVSEHHEKDYSYFLEVSCSPIFKNQKINGITFFARPVTERVEAELQLKDAKNLAEEASSFKSKFLANMSHEIRTPMNAMLGFSDLLIKTPLSKEQKQFVEIIKHSGEDLMVIVNDILDLSKIQAGKMELRLDNINLNDSLSHIVNLNTKKIEEKGNTLKLNYDESIPEWMIADTTRVTQILNNLISNANKFTENGYIELNVTQNTNSHHSTYIQFRVKDSGIGIPNDKLEDIFEEFSQIDSSLQRTIHGTGLGLSIVSNLINLMNGSISVKSELGIGSEFIVNLPLKKGIPQVMNKVDIKSSSQALIGKKILVCDDVQLNRLLAKKVLDQFNCEVYFAENGEEGIEKVKQISPDLVFMDIQMPIMNGYEATKRIREFSTVPIIAMTAHLLDEEKLKSESCGMNGFIPKPFKEEDIIEQVDLAFASNPQTKPDSKNKWELLSMPTLEYLASKDEEFIIEIFNIYLSTTETRLQELKTALLNNDFESEKKIAHTLRSSFSTFDLKEPYDLSIKIEQNLATKAEKELFIMLISDSMILIKQKRELFL